MLFQTRKTFVHLRNLFDEIRRLRRGSIDSYLINPLKAQKGRKNVLFFLAVSNSGLFWSDFVRNEGYFGLKEKKNETVKLQNFLLRKNNSICI